MTDLAYIRRRRLSYGHEHCMEYSRPSSYVAGLDHQSNATSQGSLFRSCFLWYVELLSIIVEDKEDGCLFEVEWR